MRTIQRDEWTRLKRQDRASVIDGQRHILALDAATGATVLEPVNVEGLKRPLRIHLLAVRKR